MPTAAGYPKYDNIKDKREKGMIQIQKYYCPNPKCPYSRDGWVPRIERPKNCPRCKKKIVWSSQNMPWGG